MRALIVGLVLAIGTSISGWAQAQSVSEVTLLAPGGSFLGDKPQARDVGRLVRHFEIMAFSDEHGAVWQTLTVWRGSIRIELAPELDAWRWVVERDARALAGGNMPVRLFKPGGRDHACKGGMWSENGLITRALVEINVYTPDSMMEPCLIEEIAQVLGIAADSDALFQTLFKTGDSRPFKWLTWSDAVVIRALYDKRLYPGMPKSRAMATVRGVIQEIVAGL